MPWPGKRIAELRKARGMSQRALSLAAGLNPGFVHDLETRQSRRPSHEKLAALAQALGVPVSALTTDDGTTATPGLQEAATDWMPPGSKPTAAEIPSLLCPDLHALGAVVLAADLTSWGLLRGDVAVYDMKHAPREGDLVIATLTDLEVGQSRTLCRWLLADHLIAESRAGTEPAISIHDERVTLRGPVVASFRAPHLTERR